MPVKLQLAASCLKDMPTPGHAAANPTKNTSAIPKKRHLLEPDVSEWSGLLLNEQEVAVHPVQALDVCMASSSNSIELTPLWPKSGSPSHCMRGGSGGGGGGAWPADHKPSNTKNGGQRAPPPPPPKNHPPPHPPQLPVTSSREFQLQRKQQQQHHTVSLPIFGSYPFPVAEFRIKRFARLQKTVFSKKVVKSKRSLIDFHHLTNFIHIMHLVYHKPKMNQKSVN